MKNTVFLILTFLLNILQLNSQNFEGFPLINPTDVTIVRDSFGVPHIFGETDAQVAYGLAWVNAEDAIHETQNLMYVAKGFMGRKDGISGAGQDYFVHAIGARELVEERFNTDFSPEFQKYLNGFAQGLNAYVAKYPEKVKIPKAFPVSSKDVATAYVVIMSFLVGSSGPIQDAVSGKLDKQIVEFKDNFDDEPVGSNAFALSSKRTDNGKTFICGNPHMQLDGSLSFYEAHLHSNEGLNMLGAMFHGSSSLAMGANEHLAWSMTWNYFDRVDVYKLKMHPKKRAYYEFDGKWIKLEKRPVWLKVNLSKNGKFILPVKKNAWWSKYGCTIKSDKSENYYSVRFPANMSIKVPEQLYKMNKSKSYEEFKDALSLNSLSLFNIIYADRDDNIYYVSNGMAPKRDTGFVWNKMVAGNSSKTLWNSLYSTDELPHVFNPDCGYIFNANNTPYNATGQGCNDVSCRLPSYMDERPGNNNRAHRLMEWFSDNKAKSFQDMKAIKFDVRLSANSLFWSRFKPLVNLSPEKYPHLRESLNLLAAWDLNTEIDCKACALFALTISHIFNETHCSDNCFVLMPEISENLFITALQNATDTLKKNFGKIDPNWGDIHRNIRGDKNVPLRGFPDVLAPFYPVPLEGTKYYVPKHGDTFTFFAQYGRNGIEKLETLLPCGNSINPSSKHYNDQVDLYSKQSMKIMSLKKEEVLKKSLEVYHPK